LGRKLSAHPGADKVRCLECEATFCTDGYLFDAAEWPRIRDPFVAASVVGGVRRELSPRMWRLLTCAFARSVFDWCRNPWFRDALQLAERWADEGSAPRGVKLCRTQLARVQPPPLLSGVGVLERWYPSYEEFAFQQAQEREQFAWVQLAQRCVSDQPRPQSDEIAAANRPLAAELLRDLVPNSFVPITWNPDWFTSTVRGLATHIHATREFGVMPILADALQDASCDDEQVLNHCRGEHPHVRGCWVLDAILGLV
jgi:hypothetical protein